MSNNNQVRNLSDVVSLEAWHDGFTNDLGRADLHVDVAFTTGRFGGGADALVRFKLTLKQAEVVIVIPPGEPAKVDPKTVRRDTRERSGVITDTYKSGRRAGGSAGAKVKLGPTSADLGLDLEGCIGGSASRDRLVEISESIRSIAAMHGKCPDGSHRWILTPLDGNQLEGRPWEAVEEPRLTLIDTRTAGSRSLPPVVRIEVRCRREDLVITDIALADESRWLTLQRDAKHRNRLAAAEALIRTRLFEEGLLAEGDADLSDPYARMTIAVASPENL